MRLTKRLVTEATKELLEHLRDNPLGLTTKELVGSLKFHGTGALSHYQIIKLLRAPGKTREYEAFGGMRTAILWNVSNY
jgi:hypothetical protein